MKGLWDIQRRTEGRSNGRPGGQGRLLRTPSGKPGVQNVRLYQFSFFRCEGFTMTYDFHLNRSIFAWLWRQEHNHQILKKKFPFFLKFLSVVMYFGKFFEKLICHFILQFRVILHHHPTANLHNIPPSPRDRVNPNSQCRKYSTTFQWFSSQISFSDQNNVRHIHWERAKAH